MHGHIAHTTIKSSEFLLDLSHMLLQVHRLDGEEVYSVIE